MRQTSPKRRHDMAWYALAAIPPLILAMCMVLYAIDVIIADEWVEVPSVFAAYHDRLTLSLLWSHQNENRFIIPRLILVLLAPLTGWDVRYEMFLNVIIASGTFAALACFVRRTKRLIGGTQWALFLPIVSLLVFSLSQFESWFFGIEIAKYLSVWSVTLGCLLLTRTSFGWRSLAAAIALGVVGTYSFANCLLYWPIGLLILLLRGNWKDRPHRSLCVAWVVATALVVISYFLDLGPLHASGSTPPPMAPTDTVMSAFIYPFINLGSPLVGILWLAPVAGAAGLILFVMALRTLRRQRVAFPVWGFILAIGAFAIGSSLLTTVGRFRYGLWQALASRYIPTTSLLWIADLLMIAILYNQTRMTGSKGRWRQHLLAATVIAFLGLAALRCYASLPAIRAKYERLLPARQQLFWFDVKQESCRVPSLDLDLPSPWVAFLKEHRLSVFRKGGPEGLGSRKLTVSGSVKQRYGGTVPGVVLESDSWRRNKAVSDAAGKYSMGPIRYEARYGWTGQVYPWKPGGYVFEPSRRVYDSARTPSDYQDFTAWRVETPDDMLRYLYNVLFKRQPDEIALRVWPPVFRDRKTGIVSLKRGVCTMARFLVFSKEYLYDRCPSKSDYIRECYRAFLFRDPKPSEMRYWLQAKDVDTKKLAKALLATKEFKKLFDELDRIQGNAGERPVARGKAVSKPAGESSVTASGKPARPS